MDLPGLWRVINRQIIAHVVLRCSGRFFPDEATLTLNFVIGAQIPDSRISLITGLPGFSRGDFQGKLPVQRKRRWVREVRGNNDLQLQQPRYIQALSFSLLIVPGPLILVMVL